MKKNIISIIIFSFLGYSHMLFAQTTITYKTTDVPSENCNVFQNTSSVISVNGYEHWPVSGGVKHSGSDPIILETKGAYSSGNTNNPNKGTAYAIKFPFKKDFLYTISVNVFKSSTSNTSQPYVAVSAINALPDPGNSNATACGSVVESYYSSAQTGLINTVQFNNTSAANITLSTDWPAPDNGKYFTILAYGGTPNILTEVKINSITITEKPPLPIFTLSPLTVAKACGTALSQTFTVTNVNSTVVTGYVWTIGTGWKYQGNSVATATTPSNSITLTSDANVSNLGNVSVAAQVTGTNVPASQPCIVTNTLPPYPISGSTPLCTSTLSYLVPALPTGAQILWTTIPSFANPTPNNANPTHLSAIASYSGDMVLKASITNVCTTPIVSTFLIHVGLPSIPTLLSVGKVKGTLQTNGSITYKGQAFLQTPAPNYPYQWKVDGYIQQSTGSTGEFNVPNCSNTVNGITQDYSINVKATNTCGSSEGCGIFRYVCRAGTSSTLNRIIDCTVYPPGVTRTAPTRFILSEDSVAANQLQIDVATLSEDNFAQLYPDADSLNTELVQTVYVYDVEGNLVQEADTVNAKQVNIDLSGLPEGNYNVVVGGNNDYTEQQTYKFTVVKTEQQLAEEIATGNYTIPTPDEADRKEVLKQQLFKELLNKESLVNASTILQNFLATKDQENYGFIRKITEAFDNGDTAAVSSLLSQWVPQNQQDQNCIDYFNLYLRLLSNDTFTYTDINNMYDLANRCPLKDGEIIYAARSLYNFMTESTETFDNACDGVAGKGTKRKAAPAKSRYLPTVIKVYPNPAKGSFNIDFPATEKGQSTITLTDVFGKKVLQKTVSQRLNNISLPSGTATGIYMIHITNQKTGKQQTQKIVVKS